MPYTPFSASGPNTHLTLEEEILRALKKHLGKDHILFKDPNFKKQLTADVVRTLVACPFIFNNKDLLHVKLASLILKHERLFRPNFKPKALHAPAREISNLKRNSLTLLKEMQKKLELTPQVQLTPSKKLLQDSLNKLEKYLIEESKNINQMNFQPKTLQFIMTLHQLLKQNNEKELIEFALPLPEQYNKDVLYKDFSHSFHKNLDAATQKKLNEELDQLSKNLSDVDKVNLWVFRKNDKGDSIDSPLPQLCTLITALISAAWQNFGVENPAEKLNTNATEQTLAAQEPNVSKSHLPTPFSTKPTPPGGIIKT